MSTGETATRKFNNLQVIQAENDTTQGVIRFEDTGSIINASYQIGEKGIEVVLLDQTGHNESGRLATLVVNVSQSTPDSPQKWISDNLKDKAVLKIEPDVAVDPSSRATGLGTLMMGLSDTAIKLLLKNYLNDPINEGIEFDEIFSLIHDVASDPETHKKTGWSGRRAQELGYEQLSTPKQTRQIFSDFMASVMYQDPQNIWLKNFKGSEIPRILDMGEHDS